MKQEQKQDQKEIITQEQKQQEQKQGQQEQKQEQKDIITRKKVVKKEKAAKRDKPFFFSSNRFKRSALSMLMTIVFIALVVLVNVLTGLLSDRFPSINIDMTPQGLNTLSEEAEAIVRNVDQDTQIIILATEDDARMSGSYSQVATLADLMNEMSRKITLEFKDLDENPTMITEYENESLAQGDVIVRAGDRYRHLSMSGDLFYTEINAEGTAYDYYSLVDGALANAVLSVNTEMSAKVSFVTGHNESLSATYRSDFEQLLSDQLYEVEEFNILTEEIPEDTNIVVIPAPTTDYTKEEIDKLRDFLADTTGDYDRTLMYIADNNVNTPNLSEFLEEWGVSVQAGYVAETDLYRLVAYNSTYIMVDNSSTLLEGNSYTYLTSPMSAPLDILFSYNDDISVSALWTSADTAYVYIDETTDPDETGTQALVTATLSRKQMDSTGSQYANVAVFGSAVAFANDLSNNSTYGNKSFYTDLLSELTGIEVTTTYIESVSTSTIDIAASSSTMTILGLGVFTIGLPILIVLFGLFIFLIRRHK